MCLYIRFFCVSIHALTLLNVLQMSWNLYTLFISYVAWTVLKMAHIRLMSFERHESFQMHYSLRGGDFKSTLTYLYYTKYNEIKIYHLDVQKYVSYKKWYK